MSSSEITEDARDETRACLIVFKFESHWNRHLVNKLRIRYRVTHVFAHDVFLKSGSQGLREYLEEVASKSRPDIVVFDLDYYYLFDLALIDSVGNSAKRVLISFDDIALHRINSINASACDLVLTADPLSALKYRELGIPARYFTLEASKEIYFDKGLQRDIDVLFFGSLKADRREFVDYLLEKGVRLTLIGGEHGAVSTDELVDYINRSKIVVNFAKTDYADMTDLGVHHPNRWYLQFKGRVIEAGLCGTACVSEYSPSLRLLFSDAEVPDFTTPEECHDRVTAILRDDQKRQALAKRLHARVLSEFEDSAQIGEIEAAIAAVDARVRRPVDVPVWYWRLAFKSKIRLLRKSPLLIVREMGYVLRAVGPGKTGAQLGLLMEMCLWIPWHYCCRAISKIGRTRLWW